MPYTSPRPTAIIEYAAPIPAHVNLRRLALDERCHIERNIAYYKDKHTTLLDKIQFLDQLQQSILPFEDISTITFNGSLVEIYLPVTAFTWAESPTLFAFIEALEALTSTESESVDNPQDGNRTYHFGPNLWLVATLLEDGTCNRVLVGTKKVRKTAFVEVEVNEPIYAFKC